MLITSIQTQDGTVVPVTPVTLAPNGGSTTVAYSTVISAADVSNGFVDEQVTANGTSTTSGAPVTDTSAVVTVPLIPIAAECPVVDPNLVNRTFAQPTVTASTGFNQFAQGAVPGWNTTGTDGLIELWKSGQNPGGNIPSYEGSQFAELAATQNSCLYQSIPTTPGSIIRYSFAHRARIYSGSGIDTAAFFIRNTAPPQNTSPTTPPPLGTPIVTATDGTSAWGFYQGDYVVPAGQTVSHVIFCSVTTGSGFPSVGNFLDSITLRALCKVHDFNVDGPFDAAAELFDYVPPTTVFSAVLQTPTGGVPPSGSALSTIGLSIDANTRRHLRHRQRHVRLAGHCGDGHHCERQRNILPTASADCAVKKK